MYREPWMGWAWSAGTTIRAQGVPSGRTSWPLLLAWHCGFAVIRGAVPGAKA